jgi:uncharacterized protein
LNNVAFADDLRDLKVNGKTVYPSGRAVVYADLLALIIPDTRKIALAALLTLIFLVLLDVRSIRATILLVTPVILSLLWTLAALSWLDIRLNHFNLVALPAALAMSLSSALLIYHRYLEEGRGSMVFVMQRCGQSLLPCTIVGMATFAALPFSDHEGLRSMGITALLGLFFAQTATFLFMPAFIGYLETRPKLALSGDLPSEVIMSPTPATPKP